MSQTKYFDITTPKVIGNGDTWSSVTIHNKGKVTLFVVIDDRTQAQRTSDGDESAKFPIKPNESAPFIGFKGDMTLESSNHDYACPVSAIVSA